MIQTKSSGRAFTLAETLIYCVLLGLFASVFFLSLPIRGDAADHDLSTSVEQVSLALSRLQKAVTNSAEDKTYLSEDGLTLILLSATDRSHPNFAYDKSGNLLWRHWDYYTWEDNQISHYRIPLSSLSSLAEVGNPSLERPSRTNAQRSLVKNVTSFLVQKSDSGYLLKLQVKTGSSVYRSEALARPRN